jgi:hypothetical protein
MGQISSCFLLPGTLQQFAADRHWLLIIIQHHFDTTSVHPAEVLPGKGTSTELPSAWSRLRHESEHSAKIVDGDHGFGTVEMNPFGHRL